MEWGPRALGNRSILADPRRDDMKDILNARVKHREHVPSVRAVDPGRGDRRLLRPGLPGPVHDHGVRRAAREARRSSPPSRTWTAPGRLQTVFRRRQPLYWQVIKEFED